MTRFVGDSVTARKKSGGYSAKDRQRDLQQFQATGVHPELERRRAAQPLHALPDPVASRPHVFLEFSAAPPGGGGKRLEPLARVVVELFDDVAPAAAAHFRGRCDAHARGSFAGAAVRSVVPALGVFGGRAAAAAGGGASAGVGGAPTVIRRHAELRHVERGAVSLSLAGDEFCLALGRALPLDETHAVVGRVTAATAAALGALEAVPTAGPGDAPARRLVVARCGQTNAAGDGDEEPAAPGGADETPAAAAARLAREAADARGAVRDALAAGMRKRRTEAEAGAARGGGKRAALAGVLGDDDDEGSDSGSDATGSRE